MTHFYMQCTRIVIVMFEFSVICLVGFGCPEIFYWSPHYFYCLATGTTWTSAISLQKRGMRLSRN